MNIHKTFISDLYIIEPKVFKDSRGYFFESFNFEHFSSKVGNVQFIQDNESKSSLGVLRGLHYQIGPYAQAKLVRVITGKVLDVAVDIRKNSSTFGKYLALELSEENKLQLYIPSGFAHGFLVTSNEAIFSYKVDNYYSPQYERGIAYNDPSINIEWPFGLSDLILSNKDKELPFIENAVLF